MQQATEVDRAHHGRSRLRDIHGLDAIRQQNLPAWQPLLTPKATVGMLIVIGVIFFPIGLVLLDFSNRVIVQSQRYDDVGECNNVNRNSNSTQLPKMCNVGLTITQSMTPPIYFYYHIKGFYQNQLAYVKSVSVNQLRGSSVTRSTYTKDCKPFDYYNDNGTEKEILACGMIANSIFTDRFKVMIHKAGGGGTVDLCENCKAPNSTQTWSEVWKNWHSPEFSMNGIAWASDLKAKFKDVSLSGGTSNGRVRRGFRQNLIDLDLPPVDNEDFVVWMRIAALPDFIKLHRVINQPLNAGDQVNVTVWSWFPVKGFKGEKRFRFMTVTNLGSDNYLLAYLFISTGCVCLVFAFIFAMRAQFGGRQLGDMHLFEWKNAMYA